MHSIEEELAAAAQFAAGEVQDCRVGRRFVRQVEMVSRTSTTRDRLNEQDSHRK